MIKRMAILLVLFSFICGAALAVRATALPDLESSGTITIVMEKDGKKLEGGKIAICRVGDILVNGADYSFVLIEALAEEEISLKNPADSEIALALAKAAKEKKLPAIHGDIVKGKAVFNDVAPGLYLVTQEEEEASKGYKPIAPYLLSVPRYENGLYQSDVLAAPKVPLETAPTEPSDPTTPTKPNVPGLPQTGQLNWPVPVLSIGGLLLFVFGWILRYGRRKDDYEI